VQALAAAAPTQLTVAFYARWLLQQLARSSRFRCHTPGSSPFFLLCAGTCLMRSRALRGNWRAWCRPVAVHGSCWPVVLPWLEGEHCAQALAWLEDEHCAQALAGVQPTLRHTLCLARCYSTLGSA
jgi:hypothetical protein